MNETAILSVGQALECMLKQEVLHIAYNSVSVVRPIVVVSAEKFVRGWTTDTTVYLGFIEVKTER